MPRLRLLGTLDRRVRVASPSGDGAVDVGHGAARLRLRRVGQLNDGRAARQVQDVSEPRAVRPHQHLLGGGWGLRYSNGLGWFGLALR